MAADLEEMETPILYVKRGCPHCRAATDYLDQHNVEYESIEVRSDPAQMEKLREVSGQTKTPTMVWEGDVLADFGPEQLGDYIARHRPA